MKKALIVMMLGVFVLAFVGSVLVTNADAKGKCPKPPLCKAIQYPDGSVYVCCYEYVMQKGVCVLVEDCWWEYPL